MSRRARGFTLLEVLVAISIFAIMSSLAYAGLTRMIEGRDRIEAERERWRVLALAFVQLEDDLMQVRERTVRSSAGIPPPLPAFRGAPVDPRPLGEPSLEFTRGGVYRSPESTMPDLQRVAYQLKDGVLLRLVWPNLDRPPVGEPRAIALLSKVDNLTLRFIAANGIESETWPPPNLTGLPYAVEIAFDVSGVGRLNRILLVAQ